MQLYSYLGPLALFWDLRPLQRGEVGTNKQTNTHFVSIYEYDLVLVLKTQFKLAFNQSALNSELSLFPSFCFKAVMAHQGEPQLELSGELVLELTIRVVHTLKSWV